jgi:hypothetical protein
MTSACRQKDVVPGEHFLGTWWPARNTRCGRRPACLGQQERGTDGELIRGTDHLLVSGDGLVFSPGVSGQHGIERTRCIAVRRRDLAREHDQIVLILGSAGSTPRLPFPPVANGTPERSVRRGVQHAAPCEGAGRFDPCSLARNMSSTFQTVRKIQRRRRIEAVVDRHLV